VTNPLSWVTDLETFRDPDDLIQNRRLPPRNASGNGVRYTAEAGIALYRQGMMTDRWRIEAMMAFVKCRVAPGLYRRSPDHPDHQGQDDYLALLHFLKLAEPVFAREILEHGQKNGWVYNVLEPGKWRWSSWFGRYPAWRASAKWAAGETPWVWERASAAIAILWAAAFTGEDQDGWVMSWHVIRIADNRSWMVTQAAKFWRWRFKKFYPGGMKQVLVRYFGFAHPLAMLWVD
jgi:hypothetical protein